MLRQQVIVRRPMLAQDIHHFVLQRRIGEHRPKRTMQDLPTWLDCHVRMYEFFSGASAITVPDNLRAAIKTPDRYEAEINPAYRELAEHYGTCIIAARVRKPRDKGKVEAAVLGAQRWILAVLRHHRFYHLEDLNQAIAQLLTKLNDRHRLCQALDTLGRPRCQDNQDLPWVALFCDGL